MVRPGVQKAAIIDPEREHTAWAATSVGGPIEIDRDLAEVGLMQQEAVILAVSQTQIAADHITAIIDSENLRGY